MYKLDKDKWVNFTIRGQLFYHHLDERSKGKEQGHRSYFEMTEAEFYAKGQITKRFQFFTQWECYYKPIALDGKNRDDKEPGYKKNRAFMKETGVNLVFAPEFKIRFGRIRIPVSRYHQRSDYKKIIPTDYFYRYDVYGIFKKKEGGTLSYTRGLGFDKTALKIREPGILFLGDTFNGMFRYYVGLFNQPNSDYEDVRPTIRLAFTPTILGFKPESSLKGTRGDSYLGKKDIFTIGFGYSREKINPSKLWGKTAPTFNNDMFAVDATFEKKFETKFGSIVPNLGIGYIWAKKTHLANVLNVTNGLGSGSLGGPQDSHFWWVQGQLLYDREIGFGKPAIAVRHEQMVSENAYNDEDVVLNRWSACLHYFLQGYNAWISVGVDYINYDDGAAELLNAKDLNNSMLDWNFYFQFRF